MVIVKHIMHTLDLELPGTERVSDILNGVTETVGIVVGRVDAPLATSPWVSLALDPVCHWIFFTVFQSHLHAQCGCTLIKSAIFHVLDLVLHFLQFVLVLS